MDANEIRKAILSGKGYRDIMNRSKSDILKEAVKITHGNISRACRLLKMHRNTFHRNVVSLAIEKDLRDLHD